MIVSDFKAVSESIARLGLFGWAIVLGLSLANYGLRFIRWQIYLKRFSSEIPILQSLAFYLSGFAFTTTPGKAGEAIRSLYLKGYGVAYVHSLAAFFTERFIDLIAMILLALFAAFAFPEYHWMVIVVSLVMVALMFFIHSKVLRVFFSTCLKRLRSERLRTIGLRLLDMIDSASILLSAGPLYSGVLLGLVAWGAEGVALHLILAALEVDISPGLAIGIYSISVLAGALSFIPGGLGSTEAIMVLLLKFVGADTATAVAATLICRLATLWFAVVIGGIVIAFLGVDVPSRKSS